MVENNCFTDPRVTTGVAKLSTLPTVPRIYTLKTLRYPTQIEVKILALRQDTVDFQTISIDASGPQRTLYSLPKLGRYGNKSC